MKKWAVKAFDENGDTFIHRPAATAEEAGQLIAEVLTYDREGGVGGVTVLRSTSLTVEDHEARREQIAAARKRLKGIRNQLAELRIQLYEMTDKEEKND